MRVALVATALAAAAAAPAPPNIVLILSDDLGFAELSIQPRGPARNTNLSTPNIDALFRSGLQFLDAYVGEAVCAPSRTTLMTGRHTGHTYIRGNYPTADGHDLALRPQDVTVFSLLQAQGYHVACVGKWGVGYVGSTGAPDLKGCSSYFGVLDQAEAHDMYPSAPSFTWRYPASNGSRTWEGVSIPGNVNASRARCMAPGNACVWAHQMWTDAALAALEAQAQRESAAMAAGGAAAAPLLLYLAYTDPHAGGWGGTAEVGNPVPSDAGPVRDFSGESWPNPEKDHASVISNFQDADVGKIVALLEARGLRDHTAVFFASDNGASNEGDHDYMFFESSGPLRGFKRCLTEGGIRTPFAVSWPGVIAPRTSSYTIAFWDLLPTLTELAAVPTSKLPPGIDGISFVNELLSQPQAIHPALYWEFCTTAKPPSASGGSVRSGKGWAHAVRNGTMKGLALFSEGVGSALELYDLSVDIGETHDIARSHPAIVAAFEAFAKAAHEDNALFPVGDAACTAS